MTTTTSGHKLVLVELLDATGESMGRAIPVEVWYTTDTFSYGEDADGRRGEYRQEVTMLDHWINPHALRDINSAQVEQILDDARRLIEEGMA